MPITGATASISTPVFSYYHVMNFFGRTANFTFAIPYGVGNFNGTLVNVPRHLYRSGMLDSFYRFSVNLYGGRAMEVRGIQEMAAKDFGRSELESCCSHGPV